MVRFGWTSVMFVALIGVGLQAANATVPVWNADNTVFLGFNGIDIAGASYDVLFVDGSYDDLTAAGTLSGFATLAAGDVASAALLNAFHSFGDPVDWIVKTAGCGDTDYCVYMTPSGAANFGDPPRYFVSDFINSTHSYAIDIGLGDRVEHGQVIGSDNFKPFAVSNTFASWSISPANTEVAEPSSLALFGIGALAAIGFHKGRKTIAW